LLAKAHQALRLEPHVFHSCHASRLDQDAGVLDQVRDQAVEHALKRLVELELGAAAWVPPLDRRIHLSEQGLTLADGLKIEQSRLKAIVQIRGVIGDLDHAIDQLPLERWALVEHILHKLGELGWGVLPRVLDDALAHFEGQVQAGEIEVALLESLDDAQRMEVKVEPVAEWTHELVETALARVAEGRVADVVNKRERLGE